MKKSQLRNIIRESIKGLMNEQTANAHSHITVNICGCVPIPGAPNQPGMGGMTPADVCDAVNTFNPNTTMWIGMSEFLPMANIGYTGFKCGGVMCDNSHLNGPIFKLPWYPYAGNPIQIADIYFEITGLMQTTTSFTPWNMSPSSCPQFGCIDPNANNYNSNANTDDGSCIYTATNTDLEPDIPSSDTTNVFIDTDIEPDIPSSTTTGHLDNDRDRAGDNTLDCLKFWNIGGGNFAQDCCDACENLNLHPLSHPNHTCTQWCHCCDEMKRLQELANISKK